MSSGVGGVGGGVGRGSSVGGVSRRLGAGGGGSYAWERAYERTWDAVREDADGLLQVGVEEGRLGGVGEEEEEVGVRRHVLRALVLVLDMSEAMTVSDPAPSRVAVVLSAALSFCRTFLERNPLATLGIVSTARAEALVVCAPSSDASRVLENLTLLQVQADALIGGPLSFQAALETSRDLLRSVPSYALSEVLVIHGAVATVDAGDVFATTDKLVADNIRVSFLGLAGEVFVAKRIATLTNGTCAVAENLSHFKHLLASHATPPVRTDQTEDRKAGEDVDGEDKTTSTTTPPTPTSSHSSASSSVVEEVGFPKRVRGSVLVKSGSKWVVVEKGFECPRCATTVSSVPCSCPTCSLRLASASHLARSYHHLFPIPHFLRIPCATEKGSKVLARMSHTRGAEEGEEGEDGGEGGEGEREEGTGGLWEIGRVLKQKIASLTSKTPHKEFVASSAFVSKEEAKGMAVMRLVERAQGGALEVLGERCLGGRGGGEGTEEVEEFVLPALQGAGGGGEVEVGEMLLEIHPSTTHTTLLLTGSSSTTSCAGCNVAIPADLPRTLCPRCHWPFCTACDQIIHQTLHHCPGCSPAIRQ